MNTPLQASMPPQSRARGVPTWIIASFVAYAVWRSAYYIRKAIPAWESWRHGAPDAYPNQHEWLFWTAAAGLAGAIVLPVPLFMTRMRPGRVWILFVVWAILMVAWITLDQRAAWVSLY